jgi:hypothetical protein
MISIRPATLRSIYATSPKTEPKLVGGCFIGAFVLTFVLETALASDPQIEFIERYGTNQITIHFNTDAHRSYTLQCYGGGNSGTWTNIYTVPPDPFPNHYVVVARATNGSGFYRLAVTP